MKLFYCHHCQDVRKLHWVKVRCRCRKAWGKYKRGGLDAVLGGSAIPLGIDNHSFVQALQRRVAVGPEHPIGLVAFIIEDPCPTVSYDPSGGK